MPTTSLNPHGSNQTIGTRSSYELKIKVDYFEGLLRPEVIEGFEFLESYFEDRGIQIEIDFNSTNNVIEGKGYVPNGEVVRTINRQYHDHPTTHTYFLVARTFNGNAGGAFPLWGAGIGLEMADRSDIRFLIMHEIGHCIGIGLQDDDEGEVYPSSGFMGYYRPNITEYRAEDWNSSFAPDGAFGNQTRKQARMWNRYSIIGEIYDDTSDVMGNVTGDIVSNGPVIYLKEVNGTNEYGVNVSPFDGTYSFQAKPGNYTLEVAEGFKLDKLIFVNITERETIHLGNVTIELAQVQSAEPPEELHDNRMAYILMAISVAAILVLAFAIRYRKLKGR